MQNKQYPRYQPGSVVISRYNKIDTGEPAKGLFLVFYDEALDITHGMNSDNVLCFKVTSRHNHFMNHSFTLEHKKNPFLKMESYVITSKPSSVHKRDVEGVVGIVNREVMTDFYYRVFSQSLLSYSEQIIKKIRGEM